MKLLLISTQFISTEMRQNSAQANFKKNFFKKINEWLLMWKNAALLKGPVCKWENKYWMLKIKIMLLNNIEVICLFWGCLNGAGHFDPEILLVKKTKKNPNSNVQIASKALRVFCACEQERESAAVPGGELRAGPALHHREDHRRLVPQRRRGAQLCRQPARGRLHAALQTWPQLPGTIPT